MSFGFIPQEIQQRITRYRQRIIQYGWAAQLEELEGSFRAGSGRIKGKVLFDVIAHVETIMAKVLQEAEGLSNDILVRAIDSNLIPGSADGLEEFRTTIEDVRATSQNQSVENAKLRALLIGQSDSAQDMEFGAGLGTRVITLNVLYLAARLSEAAKSFRDKNPNITLTMSALISKAADRIGEFIKAEMSAMSKIVRDAISGIIGPIPGWILWTAGAIGLAYLFLPRIAESIARSRK